MPNWSGLPREPRWSIAPDDTPDIIAQRLALYYDVTSPIISWYDDRGILVSVDAMRSAQQVGREILAALEAMATTPGPGARAWHGTPLTSPAWGTRWALPAPPPAPSG